MAGAAFDVQAVCSGFVYALTVADAMIRTGAARKALVVGAEVFSRILDFNDRTTCVLFGDGAGAVVLEASDTPAFWPATCMPMASMSASLCVPGHVSGGQVLGDPLLEDGRPSACSSWRWACSEDAARATLAKAGMTEADIDWLIPHQANIRIMQSTGRKAQVADGQGGGHRGPAWQYLGCLDSSGFGCCGACGSGQARPDPHARRRGRRLHLGRCAPEFCSCLRKCHGR